MISSPFSYPTRDQSSGYWRTTTAAKAVLAVLFSITLFDKQVSLVPVVILESQLKG